MVTRAIVAAALLCAACGTSGNFSSVAPPATDVVTTVVLVRHAEKADAPADDPPLTPEGEQRARALLDALDDANVSAVFTTQFERTRATAVPLAAAIGVPVTVIPAGGNAPPYVQAVVERVRRYPGKIVVVVSHSNTIGPIIRGFGGPDIGEIPEDEYDGFYTLLLQDGQPPQLIRTRYGAE